MSLWSKLSLSLFSELTFRSAGLHFVMIAHLHSLRNWDFVFTLLCNMLFVELRAQRLSNQIYLQLNDINTCPSIGACSKVTITSYFLHFLHLYPYPPSIVCDSILWSQIGKSLYIIPTILIHRTVGMPEWLTGMTRIISLITRESWYSSSSYGFCRTGSNPVSDAFFFAFFLNYGLGLVG